MSKEIKKYKIINFYKFIKLNNLSNLRKNILYFLEKKQVKGTILLANEGLNVNICCKKTLSDEIIKFIKSEINLKDMHVNAEIIEFMPFKKLKIKIKNEIIKSGFTADENLIKKNTYVNPDEWDQLINDKITIIDTRNRFEFALGTFRGAIDLDLLNFSDFEKNIIELKNINKNKKVAIFCTGGIRCEKASLILEKSGFKNIVQLKGGIINYIKNKNKKSNWLGKCFVFDDRVVLT